MSAGDSSSGNPTGKWILAVAAVFALAVVYHQVMLERRPDYTLLNAASVLWSWSSLAMGIYMARRKRNAVEVVWGVVAFVVCLWSFWGVGFGMLYFGWCYYALDKHAKHLRGSEAASSTNQEAPAPAQDSFRSTADSSSQVTSMKYKKLIPIVIAIMVVSYGALFVTNSKVLVWEKKWICGDKPSKIMIPWEFKKNRFAQFKKCSSPADDRWLCTYFTGRGLIRKEYQVKDPSRHVPKTSRYHERYKDSCPNILR